MHVQAGRRERGDGDLAGAVLPRQPAGEDPGNVQHAAEPAVQRGLRDRRQIQPASWPDRLHIEAHHGGDPAHTPQPGQRQVVAVQAGAGRCDQQVRGVRGVQETRVGAAGPPCPRSGGHDRAARERDQRHEHRPAPPPGSELVRHEEQDHAHQASPPAGLRPPCAERKHYGCDLPGCSRRQVGTAGTTIAVMLAPFAAGRKPWPNGRQCSWTGGMALAAGWMIFRAELRRRWRAWLALALVVGAFAGQSRPRPRGRAAPTPPTRACWPGATHRTCCCFPPLARPRRSAGSRSARRRTFPRPRSPPS